MSTQQKRGIPLETVSEESVADYLAAHPDFFERYQSLLGLLQLPHHAGTGAVSLVERQVDILRQRNGKLERKLRELVGTARANDELARKIHGLALKLIGSRGFADVLGNVQRSLREDFGADEFMLVLFDTEPGTAGVDQDAHLKHIDRDDPSLKVFQTFLSGSAPRCGRIQKAQREFLFGEGDPPVASAALAPLGPRSEQGFLAVGSYSASHFHPGIATDFLARIGDLVAHALAAGNV